MSDAKASTGEHKPHVLPLRIYVAVGVTLLILTYVTVKVSYMDFGIFNLVVGLGIASIKATLVVLFFMHLKYDEPFNAIVFVGSLGVLGIFFLLTLADTMERGNVDAIEAEVILPVPARPDLMEGLGHGEGSETNGAAEDSIEAGGNGH